MTAFERYGVKKAKKPIYAAYSFRERLNRAQFVVLNGIINIYIHAVHAGRMGVMLNNEDIATVKKGERSIWVHDFYGQRGPLLVCSVWRVQFWSVLL